MKNAIELLESRTLLSAGPTAILRVIPRAPAESATSIQFQVTYTDRDGIDPSSLDSRDLRISGPNDFARYARAVTSTANADATIRIVRYKMASPGRGWDVTDNGTYTVKLRGAVDGVSDLDGHFATAQTLGKFTCNIPSRGAAVASFHPFTLASASVFGSKSIASDLDQILSDL